MDSGLKWVNDRSDKQQDQPPEVLLKISQNSQENTCARVSFSIKFFFIKEETLAQCFPVNFVKFLRTLISIGHLRMTVSEAGFLFQIASSMNPKTSLKNARP